MEAKGIKQEIQFRLERLKSMPIRKLRGLPTYGEEEIVCGKERWIIAQWVEPRPDGKIAVIIQGFRHLAFGIYKVFSVGFVASETETKDLSPSEFEELC